MRIAVKNWALERAIKTSAHWQRRARHAEAIVEQIAEQHRHAEDQPWWANMM